ncbi:hypothetical protein V1638_06915 [Pseudarthrobacter sp. J64]|uniref:hypothetical protein n=1 Tax=Pseudarthrobacter sp. J64 TaxID=3116485 RepID=UPI002E81AAA7|nr:hypothetical protein [Pseudarthrobacter sp. J64]MEE2569128.1 hypothetical protein [Pseudarthrobacter sp. J64]
MANNGTAPVTLTSLLLEAGPFGAVSWNSDGGGTVLPPGQPKSLVTELPEPLCLPDGSNRPASELTARLELAGEGPDTAAAPVSDDFGVLDRNLHEYCLEQPVRAIAAVELLPELHSNGAGSATIFLAITPAAEPSDLGATKVLRIERILGTTLLAADPAAPWPEGLQVRAGDPPRTLQLQVRPARCDPHAVAEDKVGTLLPLMVDVGGVKGTIKAAARPELKGAIHDFVSAACLPG